MQSGLPHPKEVPHPPPQLTREIRVLHLEDECRERERTAEALTGCREFGVRFHYVGTADPEEFRRLIATSGPSCLLLDLVLGTDALAGLSALRDARRGGCLAPAVVMSHVATGQVIESALRAGATDFLTKGLDDVELAFRLAQATQERHTQVPRLAGIAGDTLHEVAGRLAKVAASSVRSVLVLGESGTGKEVVADILRRLQPGVPFVSVNCGAIARDLFESELFGARKGAYTGAHTSRRGLVHAAHGGWLFLDEVARLSLPAQGALLRFLESGEARSLGASQADILDVRILSATNEDLPRLVEAGEFRNDLLQRLRAYSVVLPPLRERTRTERGEILGALMERLPGCRLSPAARQVLLGAPWTQGNAREMWHALQTASLEAHGGVVTIGSLAHLPLGRREGDGAATQGPVDLAALEDSLLGDVLDELLGRRPDVFASQRRLAGALTLSRHSLNTRLRRLVARGALRPSLKDALRPLT